MRRYQALKKLDGLIGLGTVKKSIREILEWCEVNRLRKQAGLKNVHHSLHMVFTGNPGTGKTTVARIVGELMGEAGFLKPKQKPKPEHPAVQSPFPLPPWLRNDHDDEDDEENEFPFVEISNDKISSRFWGGDEENIKKHIRKAEGGVLFIDEAYTMVGKSSYEQKAFGTLIRYMENMRDRLIVIAAGYEQEMQKFLDFNPGAASRFANVIHFPDYTTDELLQVAEYMCGEYDYRMSESYKEALAARIEQERKEPNFANARSVRNVLEKSIRAHAHRVANIWFPSRSALMTLEAADMPAYVPPKKKSTSTNPWLKLLEEGPGYEIGSGDGPEPVKTSAGGNVRMR